jgi:hypothetical protein
MALLRAAQTYQLCADRPTARDTITDSPRAVCASCWVWSI